MNSNYRKNLKDLATACKNYTDGKSKETYTNLINYNDAMDGYYSSSNGIDAEGGFTSYYIPVSANDVLYLNYKPSELKIGFVDSNKTFIQMQSIFNTNVITVPDNSNIAYLTLPVSLNSVGNVIISKEKIPFNTNVNNSTIIYGAFTGRYDIDNLYGAVANSYVDESTGTVTFTKRINTVGVRISSSRNSGKWSKVSFNTNYLRCKLQRGFILLAYNPTTKYTLANNGAIYKFSDTSFEVVHNFGISNLKPKILNCYLDKLGNVLIKNGVDNSTIISFNLNDYATLTNDFILSFGWVYFDINEYVKTWDNIAIFDINPNSAIQYKLPINYNHWYGKKWYAYGTSLTSTSEGKYAPYLAQFSGMKLTNKGIGGGALVANRNIYNALMDNTDGKVNADLITIEVGPNDGSTPIGNPTDLVNTTFCGALNLCIKNIYENCPKAQIVIMCSHQSRYALNDPTDTFTIQTERAGGGTWFDLVEAVKKVATVQGCYYVNYVGVGLGLYRMLASNLYNVDQIHETNLGGYNIAKGLWEQIKNIPLWYNSIPE